MIGIFRRIQSKLKESKEAKVLLENFLSLSVLKLLGYIFPLLTLPYLARVIGVDKFGEIAFAASIIMYFQTLVDFGFNYSAVRDIARNRDNTVRISKIFSTIIVARIILMVICLFILLILIFFVPLFYENRLILLLTFLYVPGSIILTDWFFQAMEEMKYITFLNLLSKLLFTVLVFVIIKKESDYIFQPLLIAFGDFISGIVSIPLILKKYKLKLEFPAFRDIFIAIKGSWNIFICLFLPNLYSNFSVILLKTIGGSTPTGIFSGGYRFIDLVDQLTLVLSRTFYPFLSRRFDMHKTYVKISFSISVLAGLCLFFGADLLIKIFYTKEFADSATVIRIMSICPFFLFIMNTYGTNFLILIGKENVLRNIIMFCSFGGLLLSWFMVSHYSYIGVAVTLAVVWGIRGFLTWFYANKHKGSVIQNK
jgi:O-antigen/teichoic acid export membrane protein